MVHCRGTLPTPTPEPIPTPQALSTRRRPSFRRCGVLQGLEPLHPEQCRTVACNSGPLQVPPTFSRPSLLPLKAVIVLPTELSTVESHRLGLLHEATRPRQQLSKKWMVHPLEDPVPCAMKYFAKPCPRSPCPNVGTNTRRRTVKPRI